MNRNTVLKIGGFLILALAMLSCTDTNLSPVFYAIEHEKSLVDDRGFPDDAVVLRIVQNGTGGNYFAAAGILYTRAPGGGTWSSISPPVSGALCTNVEIFSGKLLAAFILPDNTGLGLRQRNLPLDASGWSQVSDATLAASARIDLLKTANANLFVSTYDGSNYRLYYATTLGPPSDFAATSLATTPVPYSSGPITDVIFGQGSYWVSVGSTLYSAASPGAAFAPDATVSTDRAFGDLFVSSGGTLYLAADGKFYTNPGTGWAASSSISVDGKSVQFSTFVEIPVPPLITNTHVYAGTKGYGYYDYDTVTESLVRSPSYTISALYDGAILSMLFDGSTLLLGTYNSGLWRGDFIGGSEIWAWKQE